MIDLSISQAGGDPDFTLNASWDTQIAPKEIREVFEQAFDQIGERVRPKPVLGFPQEFGPASTDFQPLAHGPLSGSPASDRDYDVATMTPSEVRAALADLKIRRQNVKDLVTELDSLKSAHKQLRQAQHDVVAQRDRALSAIEESKELQRQIEEQRESWARKAESLAKDLEKLGKSNDQLVEDLRRAEAERDENARHASVLLQRLDEVRGERDKALERLGEVSQERDEALDKAKELETKLGEVSEIAEQLQSEFTRYKAGKKRREANCRNRIKSLTEELAEDRLATARAIDVVKKQVWADLPNDDLIRKNVVIGLLDNITRFAQQDPFEDTNEA